MHERNEQAEGNVEARRSGPSPALLALVVLAVLAVVFILQNGERTETTFVVFDVRAPLWVALAVAIALGVVLDRLATLWWRRRRRAD